MLNIKFMKNLKSRKSIFLSILIVDEFAVINTQNSCQNKTSNLIQINFLIYNCNLLQKRYFKKFKLGAEKCEISKILH